MFEKYATFIKVIFRKMKNVNMEAARTCGRVTKLTPFDVWS